MIEIFIKNLLVTSLLGSICIILIIAFRKTLFKKYTNAFNYYIWLAVIFKMIILFKIPINMSEKINDSLQSQPDSIKILIYNRVSINKSIEMKNSINNSYIHNNTINYFTIVFYIWLTVSILFLIYHIISYLNYSSKIKAVIYDVPNNDIKDMYSNLLVEMNIKRKISLKFCKEISTPLGIGIFNAHILIPEVSYDIKQLEYILRHELMHYKRFDILYKVFLLITMAIHWFNPPVYIMYKEINNDCELSCDEAVLRRSNMEERKSYALTLVNSLKLNKNGVIKQTFIMKFNDIDMLKKRVESMLNLKTRKKGLLVGILVVVVTVNSLVSLNVAAKNEIGKETKVLSTNTQSLEPKQVLENYFKYYNGRNKEGIRLTRTDSENFVFSEDEDTEYLKLDRMSETFDPSFRESYMKNGRGTITGATEENMRLFRVVFTVKWKMDGIGPVVTDKFYKWATFIRKDKNSPWLLDEIGEG